MVCFSADVCLIHSMFWGVIYFCSLVPVLVELLILLGSVVDLGSSIEGIGGCF